jgi:hypothetical protein
MSALKRLFLGSCILAVVLMFSPVAKVSEMDQKVVGTFSAPVMIPGQVLPAGTYVFKVLNVSGSRDVIQVSTADESKSLAIAFTVPRYRANPGDKQIFQFEERGADSPQAIKSWFYPGFSYGHEFVYPKTVATVDSGVNNSAGPAPAPSSPSVVTPEQPAADASAPVVPETTPTEAPSQTPQTSTAPAETDLPKTASSTPLIGLVGMLLLGGAFGLRALTAWRS